MKVNELFEAGREEVAIKVKSNPNVWTATGEVNGRKVEFTGKKMTTVFDKKPVNSWEIEFTTEDMEGEQTLDLTGMGDAFGVFSFVNTALKAFMKAKNPPVVSWTAENGMKGNRASLYTKVFKKSFPNFSVKTGQRDDGEFSVSIAQKKK